MFHHSKILHTFVVDIASLKVTDSNDDVELKVWVCFVSIQAK